MNDIQKAQIRELRLQGVGYRKIAKETGMAAKTTGGNQRSQGQGHIGVQGLRQRHDDGYGNRVYAPE